MILKNRKKLDEVLLEQTTKFNELFQFIQEPNPLQQKEQSIQNDNLLKSLTEKIQKINSNIELQVKNGFNNTKYLSLTYKINNNQYEPLFLKNEPNLILVQNISMDERCKLVEILKIIKEYQTKNQNILYIDGKSIDSGIKKFNNISEFLNVMKNYNFYLREEMDNYVLVYKKKNEKNEDIYLNVFATEQEKITIHAEFETHIQNLFLLNTEAVADNLIDLLKIIKSISIYSFIINKQNNGKVLFRYESSDILENLKKQNSQTQDEAMSQIRKLSASLEGKFIQKQKQIQQKQKKK